MKKLLSAFLIVASLLCLSACDIDDPQNTISTTPITDSAEVVTENTTGSTSETTVSVAATVPTANPTIEPSASPTTEPHHIHDFSASTCTSPKMCSCGVTEGDPSGHSFSNGKCTTCGQEDPDHDHETMVWIPTKGGKKYHTHAGCSNMVDPEQVSQSEAESRGFTPCKKCY